MIIHLFVVQDFKILIVCEESDRVRFAFEKLGFDAWSCDLLPTRNPDSSKHLQMDAFESLKFKKWDAMIGFPPCTHLCLSGSHLWAKKRELGLQQEAIKFFLDLYNSPINHIALENPIGILNKAFRKYDQLIHPYYFGDPAQKSTCLWLKNLPKLIHTKYDNLFESSTYVDIPPKIVYYSKDGRKRTCSDFHWKTYALNPKIRAKERSTTFQGIANAMATQWGNYFIELYNLKQ